MVELSSRSEGSRGEGEAATPHQPASQGIEPGRTTESAARDDTPEPLAPHTETKSGTQRAAAIAAAQSGGVQRHPSMVSYIEGYRYLSTVSCIESISIGVRYQVSKGISSPVSIGVRYRVLKGICMGVRYRASKGIGIGVRYWVSKGIGIGVRYWVSKGYRY